VLEQPVGAETIPVGVGAWLLGVGTDAALAPRLRAALAAHVRDDARPPVNFSVQLASATKRRRGAGFHLLHRGSSVLVRSRDPHRVVNGLLLYLDAFTPGYGSGLLPVNGVALVGGSGALLAPSVLRPSMSRLERRLNLRGLRVVDTPWALIDPDGPTVVVPEPTLAVDHRALTGIEVLAPSRPDPTVPAGRYLLRDWVFLGDGGALTRARAVALATRFTRETNGVQGTLDALAEVMRAVVPRSVAWAPPSELVTAITECA
jgi:hypothetical protein